jgi:hypothetical protein
MPKRAEIDPRGMEGALEYALLMEVVAPGVARLRVSGMHMSDLMGMEVRGMPLTAFFEPSDRPKLAELLDEVTKGPKVIEITLNCPTGIGRPALKGKLYLAPLEGDSPDRPRILGCLQTNGEIGRTPRRFTIEDVHRRRIVAAAGTRAEPDAQPRSKQARPEPAQPDHAKVDAHLRDQVARIAKETGEQLGAHLREQSGAQKTPAFAEEAAPFTPALKSERPYLRLVKTQKDGPK